MAKKKTKEIEKKKIKNKAKKEIEEKPKEETTVTVTEKKENLGNLIPFKEWKKIDLRVGKILEVKDHPNASRLYLLKVDIGTEKRTLVAGLKEHYKPKELKGKLCVIFSNLEPATIRGVKSEGMILAAVNRKTEKEKVVLLAPEKNIDLGSKIE